METKQEMSTENQPDVRMPDEGSLLVSSSPHLHAKQDVQAIMALVMISLMPATFAGMYFFGTSAILVVVQCVVFCVLAEMLWCKLAGKPISTVKDCSAAVTGLLLGLNLSAMAPWWLCLIGALLAIWLGKQVFGGLGHNPFNPCLVARVALLIGFPKYMTTWVPTNWMQSSTMTSQYTKMFNVVESKFVDGLTCATPLGEAKEALTPHLYSTEAYWNYFIGNVGGCIGETSTLALLAGGIFLLCLRLIKWQVPVAFLGTVALFTLGMNLYDPGSYAPPLFHLLTGGLMLGAFFKATDMVTSPMTNLGAFIFGIGCGVITVVIRLFCNYPEGVSFAVLFMNALVPLIDRFARTKPFGFIKPKAVEGGC